MKRKTSPWVWVLVVLGAIVLMVVVVLGLGVWFVAHKAKQAGFDTALLKKNPGLAAVKMMTAMNPDIELIRTDDDRGVAVIRNKKENKLYTINLEEARNGKITFQEEGKPPTTLTTNTDGTGAVKITTSDGNTATLGAGGQLPSWVPAYPGATVESNVSGSSNEGSGGNFNLKTSDSSDKVVAFYQDQLKSAGFKLTSNITEQEGKKIAMLTGEDNDKRRNVTAIIAPDDNGQTVVNLTVAEKK